MPMAVTLTRWTALVEDLERSGQTVAEFAKSRDVNAGSLAGWRSKLRAERARALGVSARPAGAASSPHPGTEVGTAGIAPIAVHVPAFVEVVTMDTAPGWAKQEPTRVRLRFDRWPVVMEVGAGDDLSLVRAVVEALC